MVRGEKHRLATRARPLRLRGSALTYVLIVVSATAIAVVASVGLSGQSYRRQVSAEYKLNAQYAFEGAVAQVRSEIDRGLITPPVNKNITVGGVTAAVSVVDNSASKANTYRIDATATAKGQSYAKSFVVSGGVSDSLYNYAIALQGADNFPQRVTTGLGGSVYVGGNLSVDAWSCYVDGDLRTVGTIGGTRTISVGGTKYQNATAIATPTISAINYYNDRDLYYSTSTSFSGGTAPDGYCIYVNGDATLNSGAYGGKATLFVTGNVTINGPMTYANSSSQLVVICLGNVYCGASAVTAVGTYYVSGQFRVTQNFTLTRGSVCAGNFYMTAWFDVDFDSYFKDNPGQRAFLRLPGYWP